VGSTGAKRGRPLKFGRPTRPLSISLPDDVIAWLESLDPDPAWAIVGLFEKARSRQAGSAPRAPAELVQLPGRRALILVAPDVFADLAGVSVIRLSDGRGFLALQPGKGYADLELAVVDMIDAANVSPERRKALVEIRTQLREWRQAGLVFEARSILVVEREEVGEKTRTLSGLASA
jgi:hypothetical protein